jgi:hypothetical protein
MKETRSTIILTRLAKKLRKETGDHRYRARAEDEAGNLRTLIYISCTRPLCTLSISLYGIGIRADQTSRFIVYRADGAEYQCKLTIINSSPRPTKADNEFADMGWLRVGYSVLSGRIDWPNLPKSPWL